jgi:hypothetical protein
VYTNSLLAALNMRPFFAGQHRRSEPEAFVLSPRSGLFPGSPGVRSIEPTQLPARTTQAHRLPRCLCGSTNTLRPRLIRKAPSRGDRDAAYRMFEDMYSARALDAKCHVACPFIRCMYCWAGMKWWKYTDTDTDQSVCRWEQRSHRAMHSIHLKRSAYRRRRVHQNVASPFRF